MEYKKWLTYWKKSLSDSLKADIDIEKLQHFEIENFELESQRINELDKINTLIEFEEVRVNKKKGISDRNSPNWQRIDELQILIAPIKIKPIPENLVFLKDKRAKFPFWFFVKLNRHGDFFMPEERFPIFQRKYLEPLADERTEFVFSSVDNVDNVNTVGKEEIENYNDYINYIKNVFKLAICQEINTYHTDGYEVIKNAIILLPDEDINAAIGIIQLYEKLLNENKLPELLKAFITLKNDAQNKPLVVEKLIESNFLHLGQMGFDFPLSISQRKSLYTFLHANDKIFAVNGPPGTGKTTLLQSIVANKLVEHAIKGENAPIILACSTNNQAVTNIIDSFSKSNTQSGDLEGRWLPDVDGYATYLPANGKTETELAGINYKKQDGKSGLFNQVENNTYLEKAKVFFSKKCSQYFKIENLTISDAVKKLQKEIIDIQFNLKNASIKWKKYLEAEYLFLNFYSTDNDKKNRYYLHNSLQVEEFHIDIANLNRLEEKVLLYFKNESFFRKLFCFFGCKSALQDRISELRIILRGSLINETSDFVFTQSAILGKIANKIDSAISIIEGVYNWSEWKSKNKITGNPPANEDEYWDFEYLKIQNRISSNCFYDELDVSQRHRAFQLALHYWEGRYLIKLEEDLLSSNFGGKGFDNTKTRWERHAMLTPCFVSTFYMAPKFFSSFLFFKKGEDGKNIFDTPPLYDFIDLLIVDEAGQVSPEVGVATFALAKQAIIVGDVKQIEPVWNITHKIDIGNLKKCEIIKSYDDLIYDREYDPKGFLSSTGSIMKMAQNACNFKDAGLIEKGVVLVEHRRCYDEIINYCNVLAYNGKLKPLKGKAPNTLLFPPMYCIHVDGNSITSESSSRHNPSEVDAIVNWLIKNKLAIESKYGKIENAVGIITPFVGQKNNLKYALEKAGFDVGILKIGTVHALQGAERHIVLFSMVYGKGDAASMFFDRDNKPNMLNVAVSRAKDNFIVFANTEILEKKSNKPSGILANHLKYSIDVLVN